MDQLLRIPIEDNLVEPFLMKVSERSARQVALHWHEFYEIELYLRGSGTADINGKTYPIQPNTLSLVTPVDFHAIQANPGEKIELITITFAPACMEDAGIGELLELSHSILTRIDQATADRLVSLMRRIREEYSANAYLNRKYAANLISCILIELLRLADSTPETPSLPVQKAVYYLRVHFREPITLQEVAAFAGFSPSHMSKVFRGQVGVGLKEYLTALRLEHAEQLLRLSWEPVTNVAASCGFGSVSHFLHVFHEKFGCSPLQYRNAAGNRE